MSKSYISVLLFLAMLFASQSYADDCIKELSMFCECSLDGDCWDGPGYECFKKLKPHCGKYKGYPEGCYNDAMGNCLNPKYDKQLFNAECFDVRIKKCKKNRAEEEKQEKEMLAAISGKSNLEDKEFAKDIDKVLKNVKGLQTSGKTEQGVGGVGDMLGGLMGSNRGGIGTIAKGGLNARDIDIDGNAFRSKDEIVQVINNRMPDLRNRGSDVLCLRTSPPQARFPKCNAECLSAWRDGGSQILFLKCLLG
jgi:hypothetical protein